MSTFSMYIMSGMSFSGKSVLARKISEKLAIPIINPDKVSNELGLGLNGEFIPEKIWDDIHLESEKRVVKMLKEGKGLVYDTTALNRDQRDHLREIAISAGANPIVVVVNIPREEAYKRWVANNESKERFVVHIEDFNMCADGFEFPENGESFIVYNFGEDADEWIAKNLNNNALWEKIV